MSEQTLVERLRQHDSLCALFTDPERGVCDCVFAYDVVSEGQDRDMRCQAYTEVEYDFRRCPNKAKWRVRTASWCGVHARLGNMWVKAYGRVPIKQETPK